MIIVNTIVHCGPHQFKTRRCLRSIELRSIRKIWPTTTVTYICHGQCLICLKIVETTHEGDLRSRWSISNKTDAGSGNIAESNPSPQISFLGCGKIVERLPQMSFYLFFSLSNLPGQKWSQSKGFFEIVSDKGPSKMWFKGHKRTQLGP